jgi:tRNA threonylcarbamoyladenosine biosynthesis protein TsaE
VIRCHTKSSDDTRELAAALATLVRSGDVILLAGDLGTGKTTLTQGFARALGVEGHVTSPTFTLMHEYEGRDLRVLHVDVYRLDRLQEVVDLGITELVDDDAVAIIEWGDVAEAVLPNDFLEVRLSYDDDFVDDDARTLLMRAVGIAWTARLPALRRALERWDVGA